MRKNIYLYRTLIACSCIAMTACQKDNDLSSLNGEEVALSLSPVLSDMDQQPLSRATANSFFKEGDKISVKVTTSRSTTPEKPLDYTYKSGIFTGNFRFKLDNTYITELEASWPTDDANKKTGIITDQRKLTDHQQADRLKSITTAANIMPTAAPVPLTFEHVQSRFSFRMAGQNANGLTIRSIILELQADVDEDGTNEAAAFWAYCPKNESASLILPPGVVINTTNCGNEIVNKRYMIGMANIGTDKDNYTGGIWLDEKIDLTLEGGKDYLITLTPEGYNLIASITIGGFGQNEGFVGIPIQLPKKVADGRYQINNITQLVTLSRILAGEIYKQDPIDWKSYNYTITQGLIMTENAKLYYKPIDALVSQFNGTATIKDTQGNDFALFKN